MSEWSGAAAPGPERSGGKVSHEGVAERANHPAMSEWSGAAAPGPEHRERGEAPRPLDRSAAEGSDRIGREAERTSWLSGGSEIPASAGPSDYEAASPVQPGRRPRRWGRRAGGGLVAAGGAAKLAGKAFLLAKGFAVIAKFKTALSMLVSVAFYALFWGWRFAVGFVLLMFVHEVGHVVVLRAQGVRVSAPMFIPFLGAFVAVKDQQRSVVAEAVSSIAGPVFGTLGAGAVLLAAEATGSPLLHALAYTGFLLNLFNLLPVLPLDGGRVAGALHPLLWIVGVAAAVLLLIFYPSPVLVFVLVLGGIELFHRWRDRRSGRVNEYYSVPASTRWRIATAYVGLAVLCLAGMHAAFVPAPRG